MTTAAERWTHLRATLKTLGLLGRAPGTKVISDAYWSEVHSPTHAAGHGREGNVDYLTATRRAKHKVTFEGRTLEVPGTKRFVIQILANTTGEIIFVVDADGNFYAGKKNLGQFHHSSFLAGGPALGAGTIILGEGYQVLEVNNHSGHYKPGLPEMKNVAATITALGGDLSLIPFRLSGGAGVQDRLFGNGQALLDAV